METCLTKSFGLSLTVDPSEIPTEELRTLLSQHGVLLFRNRRMTKLSMSYVMSKLGKLQDWDEQQAPLSYTDKENLAMINLYNEDFLGKSRMAWHMDQTYLTTPYLPVRSLYTPFEPTPGNITSFMDLKAYSNYLNQEYPELINEQARYFINANKENFNVRPVYSYCEHVGMNLFRLDSRMQFINPDVDIDKFKKISKDAYDQTKRFNVNWKKWDFVIFDNNQSPHRRSEMAGECHLNRFTSTFWLA